MLINGIEGAGKGETVKLLNEWMDPRLIEVRTFDQQTDEELARPPAWRYWRTAGQGAHGRVLRQLVQPDAAGPGAWRVQGRAARSGHHGAERLEKMLCDEGALIFKFWFHLSKKQMKARLKALADDPLHSWRISPLDWQQSQTYDKFVKYGERVCAAPAATTRLACDRRVDPRYRSLAVGKILLEGLQGALKRPGQAQRSTAPRVVDRKSLLDSLDLTLHLDKKDYEEQLITEQARLSGLMRDKRMRRHALVAVFEGNDAAGKGGAIRRVAAALDPRQYDIVPIAAPTEEEARPAVPVAFLAAHSGARQVHRVRPLLVWPGAGGAGRRLLQPGRLDARLQRDQRLRRATADAGVIVVKFWLAIDKQTQLERFQARERSRSSASRSPRTTGATATSGTTTARRGRHGRPHQHRDRPGPWWKPMTSAGRG
jgi:polyphosphate kinase 2 (PPK2 family)